MNRFLHLLVAALFAVVALSAHAALPATCPTISVTPTNLPDGDSVNAYTSTVTSANATAPVTMEITSGVLPNGIDLTDNGDGSATFSGVATQIGTFEFTITATDANGCSGGRTYAPTFAVASTATALALTAGTNPSVFGQSLTFTATVTSASGTPTGTVTFKDGATTLGTGTLNGSGQAAFTTGTLAAGTHAQIVAVYAGNGSFGASTSSALSQTVNQAATTTTLGSSVNPSVFGQPVTLTATVAAVAPGAGTPTGTVTFADGATTLGTGTLDGSGLATLTTSTLTVGAHSITATYGADTNFVGSTSSPLSQTVNQAATTTTVVSGTNPSVFGQSVTFTATVTATAPGAGTPIGTVNFLDGATSIGSGTLNGSGQATFTTSALAVASHSITASYGADTNFSASTSSALSQTVNQAATTTTLISSANPSAANQSVTFTATVTATAPGVGTPTGIVTFFDGATTLGTGTLNGSSQAMFMTSTLAVGSHSITATYAGDSSFTGSLSAPLTQTVNLSASVTTLTSSVNPAVFGQPITFTATVTSGAGTPTGTVAFMDGATLLGSGTLVAGVATFTTGSLAVGTHAAITAVYGGDSNFATSMSGPLSQTVNQAATSTTLGSSVNPSVFGQGVTITATVAAVAPGAGTPTGTVTFKEGVTVLASAVALNASGQATFTSGAFTVGAHAITAFYSADTNFLASDNTASPLTQTVNQAATTTAVASGTNPSVVGQNVTFTATVTANAPGAGTPTGTVTFKDGATTLGAGTLNGSGQAMFATGSLTLGGHSITATYGADTNFTASTSSALNQTVNQATTTTTAASNQNPSVSGQSVTFTANVAAVAPGAGTPTGTVTFKDGATTLGTGTLAGGVATFATSALGVGGHSITAIYGGDANFTGSTSSALIQNVNQPPSITSANSTTFAPGKAGQTFSVTTTGFPSGASMSITQVGTVPSNVTFTNNNDGTATIAGTPAAGTQSASPYAWTITANNGVAPNANQSFTFNVVCPAITVNGAIPALTFNTAMTSTTFTQAGGNGTIAWSATGLPTGVSINGGTGAVTGTPSATGTFSATITATDAGGCTGSQTLSVAVVPIAPAQSYTGVGNTQFFITGVTGAPTTPAVSSGNTLLTGVAPAVSTVTTASCSANGALSGVDTTGHFIMTPNVSATSVTCTYTVSSDSGATGTPASTSANLTFTLNNKVWYVSHGSVGTHDGRSNTPFLDMGGGANNLDCTAGTATGDFIYIAQGTAATAGACVLKANQTLIGAGATLNVPNTSPILTVAGTVANSPTLTGTLSASASAGLTVNGVSMSTGGSTAVNFVNSDGSFTFTSVSTSGATQGIVWNNSTGSAATGSFTIVGNGGVCTTGTPTCSGGSIQGSTSEGVLMNKASNVSLALMKIQNSVANNSAGVHLIDTSGTVTLANDLVTGSSGTSAENLAIDTSINSTAVLTTLNVTNGSYSNAAGEGILVQLNHASTLTNGTITGATFTSNASYPIDLVENSDTGFTSTLGDGVGGTAGALTISGCTFTNNKGIGPSFASGGGNGIGKMYVRFTGNTLTGTNSHAVNVVSGASSAAGSTQQVLLDSNIIGSAGVVGSGSAIGEGIVVTQQGLTTQTVTITNNTIRQIPLGRGIDVQALGPTATGQNPTGYPSSYSIKANDVNPQDTTGFPLYAIYVGVDDQGSPTLVHAEIHGNTVPTTSACDSSCSASTGMIWYEQVTAPSSGTLFNFSGVGANVSSEIMNTNTGTAGKTDSPDIALTLSTTAVTTVP